MSPTKTLSEQFQDWLDANHATFQIEVPPFVLDEEGRLTLSQPPILHLITKQEDHAGKH